MSKESQIKEIRDKLRELEEQRLLLQHTIDDLKRDLVLKLCEFEVGDIVRKADLSLDRYVIERISPYGFNNYQYEVVGRKVLKNGTVGLKQLTIFKNYNIPETSTRSHLRWVKVGEAERWEPGEKITIFAD